MSVIRHISVLSLSALLLSSCTYIGQRFFDEDRTVPDGGQNTFGGRHIPALNPGGALYRADQTPESSMHAAENPYVNDFTDASTFHKAQDSTVQQPVPAPAPAAYQSELPAPAAPVAVAPAPVTTKVAEYTPVKPAPVKSVTVKPVIATASAAPAGYPALSATPPNPVAPKRAETRDNIKQMEKERELADAARREMTSNAEVQNMQREAATAAPATVAPPKSTAQPQQTSSDSGLSGWLNRTFSNNTPPPPAAQPASPAPAAISSNWKTVDKSAVTKPAPVISAKAPAKMTPTMKPLEPIHLVPPSDIESDTADTSPVSATPSRTQDRADTITLTPPADQDQGSRYLAENRYTSRRMRATQ